MPPRPMLQTTNKTIDGNRIRHGFSLLELLTVVAILAVIGGTVVFSFSNTQIDTTQKISAAEIANLAAAIEAFRRDTGYFPKQGPFGLTTNGGVINPENADHWPAFLASATASQRTDWFNHPANFYQLVFSTSPLANTGHSLESMQISSGRGWNGAYLKDAGHFVQAGTYTPSAHSHTPATWTEGRWDPASGPFIEKIPGIFDPHIQDIGVFVVELTNGTTPVHWGRPYLFFSAGDSHWIVSMGPNGTYEGGGKEEITGGKDDIVHYITK